MEGKPELLKVLRHYDADVQEYRVSQLIRCIVHDEARASMSVNLTRGLVNCMACGFSGDSYSIVMKKEGIGFREAIQFGEDHFGASAAPRTGGFSPRGKRGFQPRTRRPGLSG